MLNDVIYALRSIGKKPLFYAVATLTLALGIAAAPGSNGITVDASPGTLVFAGRVVILMLGVLGILAGALSLARTVPRKARGEHAVEL